MGLVAPQYVDLPGSGTGPCLPQWQMDFHHYTREALARLLETTANELTQLSNLAAYKLFQMNFKEFWVGEKQKQLIPDWLYALPSNLHNHNSLSSD